MIIQTARRNLTPKQLARNLKKHLGLKAKEADTKKRVEEKKIVVVKARDVI